MKIKRPLHTPLGIRDLEYKASIKNTPHSYFFILSLKFKIYSPENLCQDSLRQFLKWIIRI